MRPPLHLCSANRSRSSLAKDTCTNKTASSFPLRPLHGSSVLDEMLDMAVMTWVHRPYVIAGTFYAQVHCRSPYRGGRSAQAPLL